MEAQLYNEFCRYCAFGAGQAGSAEMDSAKFQKMAKESGLVDKRLSTTDLDLIFTKVKAPGMKRVDFGGFAAALQEIAIKKGTSYDAIARRVATSGGPSVDNATVAAPTRFYDDKSTYTGVHAHGGPPTTNDYSITLDNLADRSDANVRGIKVPALDPTSAQREVMMDKPTAKASPRRPSGATESRSESRSPSPGRATGAAAAADAEARVADVFVAFCSSAAKTSSELDSARFFKLCTDARLIDARFGRTQCDLVFTRAATQKRLGWAAFRAQAIPYVADGKNVSEESVLAAIASVQCVSSTGTVPDAVRFHDDKTTYTGTHGVGGPTTIDGVITLSNLADRSDANVRGIKTDAMLLAGNVPPPAAVHHNPSPLPALRGRSGTLTDDRRRSSSSAAAAAALRPTSSSPIRRDSAAGARRDSSTGATARRDSGAAAAAAQQQQRKSSLSAAGGTIAGSANRAGGVYDRLCNTNSYTGVYAERFKGGAAGGRINDDTVNCGPRGFSGHTNAGGDHIVRDISQICRR